MSKKKTKNPFCSVMREYDRADKKTVALIPVLLVILSVFTRWVSGSPIPTLYFVGAKDVIPPIWLLVLLFCISYVIAGLALGIALGKRACAYSVTKYQGARWFVICLALGYAWYPISTPLSYLPTFLCLAALI